MSTDAEPSITATMSIGEVRRLRLGSEEVVAVGSAPSGYTVLLSFADWATLQRWKLTRLRVTRGHVYACADGSRRMVARFLTNTDNDATRLILYRDGNPFNLLRSNIVVVQRSTYANARRPGAAKPGAKTRKDGSRWPRGVIAASEKLEKLLRG